MSAKHTPGPWKVVTWRRGNCGGTSLAYYFNPVTGFVVCTGPNPWGSGSWGGFPASAATEVRDLRADDSWAYSGTVGEMWTAGDLLAHYERIGGFNTEDLRAAIAKARGES